MNNLDLSSRNTRFTVDKENISAFKKELEKLINCHSIDNECQTPDFILTAYIIDCLRSYNIARMALEYHNRDDKNV